MQNVSNESIPAQTNKISTFGKICRIALLWITCPIWCISRAIFKNLKNFFVWSIYKPYLVWSKTKNDYAQAISQQKLQGFWYDKKWFITIRKILFPIDLVVHTVIAAFVTPFKFVKSFFSGFYVAAKITRDIYIDDTNAYIYSRFNSHHYQITITKSGNKITNVESEKPAESEKTDELKHLWIAWNVNSDQYDPSDPDVPTLSHRIIEYLLRKFYNLCALFSYLKKHLSKSSTSELKYATTPLKYKQPEKYLPESSIPYKDIYFEPEKKSDKSFWMHVKAAIGINKMYPNFSSEYTDVNTCELLYSYYVERNAR